MAGEAYLCLREDDIVSAVSFLFPFLPLVNEKNSLYDSKNNFSVPNTDSFSLCVSHQQRVTLRLGHQRSVHCGATHKTSTPTSLAKGADE